MSKWKEIEEQKDVILRLREQQDIKAEEAQHELDKMRSVFDEQSNKERQSLEKEIHALIELKHKDNFSRGGDSNEKSRQVVVKEKASFSSYLEELWSTIEETELRLAELQLQMNEVVEQTEIDLVRQKERLNYEKQEEFNEIDAERLTLEELNSKMLDTFTKSESELKRRKVVLENNIETGYQQLNEFEDVIALLEEQQQHFSDKIDIDPKEIERKLLEERKTGQQRIDEVRDKVSAFEQEMNSGLDDVAKSKLEQRYMDLQRDLHNLYCLKKETQESIDESKKEFSGLISKVEKSRKELLSNEEQLSKVKQRYLSCEKKHEENRHTSLDILRKEKIVKIHNLESEKNDCALLLQKEYQQMEDMMSNACSRSSEMDPEQEFSVNDIVETQKGVVLHLIKEKRGHIGAGGSKNVGDYLTRRAKLEKDQERIIEQQRRVSEHVLADIKEKESSVRKLQTQRDQFYFEREKERLEIRRRIQRIERAKSVDDIQSAYTLEFYKEEASKLREAFERVADAETRYAIINTFKLYIKNLFATLVENLKIPLVAIINRLAVER